MTKRELEEALAVFLGSRRKAKALLGKTTLRHLADAPDAELARFMIEDAARRFRAAIRLAHAVLSPPPPDTLETPEDAYAHFYPYLAGREAERFVVAACDVRYQALATTVVAEGAPAEVSVRAADVFAVAVRHRAISVVVAHNHPSEITAPSPADYALTARLVEAGNALCIPVLDHLVVCGHGYFSLVTGTQAMAVPAAESPRRKR